MTHQPAEKMKVFIVSNKTRIDVQLTPEERAQYKKFSDEYDADLAAKRAARDEPHQEPVNNVVALKSKEQLKPKFNLADLDEKPWHIILGSAVVSVVKSRGEDLMFTEKAAYRYADGLWSMETDGLSFWLNREIELAANALKQPSTNRLISEARGWIQRQDPLCRKHDEIPWDAHGMVPTESGLVNPRTLKVRPIRPDDYCTWMVKAEYDPTAQCPWWLKMLDDMFADRSPEERAATICVIQELLGAGLVDDKPRELSRALVFQGGSNFGKSGLIDVMSGLFGNDVNSTSIEALEGAHGMMGFLKRRPWVLHEAFDQRKWHFSSKVKEIVTGDPINVNIKNGPLLTIRIRGPIFWGTNHPPQFKESTKAITNRLVIIDCKREFFDDKPIGAAVEAKRLGFSKPSALVLKQEMPGLLAWAMTGLKRGLERGRLILTKSMADTIEEIRRDSNMVAGFVDECCHHDPDKMVSTQDFSLAFSAWWQQNRGETYSPPSNELIGKSVVAMADPLIATGRELRDNTRRYYAGMVLNEEGLSFHKAGAASNHLEAKQANTTAFDGQVNKTIPAAWSTKPEVIAMRLQSVTTV
jgi:P4 family phage/plasmid primase-like protien